MINVLYLYKFFLFFLKRCKYYIAGLFHYLFELSLIDVDLLSYFLFFAFIHIRSSHYGILYVWFSTCICIVLNTSSGQFLEVEFQFQCYQTVVSLLMLYMGKKNLQMTLIFISQIMSEIDHLLFYLKGLAFLWSFYIFPLPCVIGQFLNLDIW